MRELVRDLYTYGGHRLLGIIALSVAVGIGDGAGLLLLMPLLVAAGFGEGQAQSGFLETVVGLMPAGLTSQQLLIVVLVLYVLLIAALALANAWHRVLTAGFVNGFAAHLRKRAHSALLDADWLHTASLRHSHVINSLVIDVERVRHGAQQFIALCGTASLGAVYFAIAAALHPLAGGLLLLLAVGFVITLRPLSRQARDSGVHLSAAYRDMQSASEHVDGIKVTKSLGAEARVRDWYGAAADGVAAQAVRLARVQAKTQVFYRISAVVLLALLAYVAIGVLTLSLPAITIFAVLFARLTPRFRSVQQGIQALRNALPAFHDLTRMTWNAQAAVERAPVLEASPPGAIELVHAIRLENVAFVYPGSDLPAFKGLTTEIPAHAITLVTGPSGSGKSTLADLLIGLMAPSEGVIHIDDTALDECQRLAWRAQVAYLPQEAPLYAGTIRENLQWAAPGADEARLWEALTRARAADVVDTLEAGLDTKLGDRGLRLSGGQRQRIALARTLLREPKLLILDEATTGLDAPTAADIEATLQTLAKNMTVIMLGHNHTGQIADKVIDLDNQGDN